MLGWALFDMQTSELLELTHISPVPKPKVENKIEEFQEIYTVGKYASKHIKATKCCLSILGVCDDFMEQPFHRFRPEHRAMVEEMLERFNIE